VEALVQTNETAASQPLTLLQKIKEIHIAMFKANSRLTV
jgi:hypothetical protein